MDSPDQWLAATDRLETHGKTALHLMNGYYWAVAASDVDLEVVKDIQYMLSTYIIGDTFSKDDERVCHANMTNTYDELRKHRRNIGQSKFNRDMVDVLGIVPGSKTREGKGLFSFLQAKVDDHMYRFATDEYDLRGFLWEASIPISAAVLEDSSLARSWTEALKSLEETPGWI